MRLFRYAMVAAACLAAVGCSDAPSSPPVPEGVRQWQATLEQTRPDAESPNADVTLHNDTSHRVVVRGVRISWPGYAARDWQPADRWRDCRRNHGDWECLGWKTGALPFDAGATHKIDVRLLAPVCEADPADPPTVELLFSDGSRTLAPVDDPGVRALHQIWEWQCERKRLLAAVDIGLAGWQRARHEGEPALRGSIAVRRGTTHARVVLFETRGSVLLDFERVGKDDVLMEPTERTGRLPFLIASNGRCDPHSVGQSTQTYILRLWVTLDDQPPQPLAIHPPPQIRRQMDRLIYQTCDLAKLESG